MDFPTEDYVRIYVRNSPTARVWGFFTRVLMDQLVKVADKAGVVWLSHELVADKFMAIASALECPDVDWVREHYPPIEQHGAAVYGKTFGVHEKHETPYIYLPRYREAQYTTGSKELNNRRTYAKKIAIERAVELGIIEED